MSALACPLPFRFGNAMQGIARRPQARQSVSPRVRAKAALVDPAPGRQGRARCRLFSQSWAALVSAVGEWQFKARSDAATLRLARLGLRSAFQVLAGPSRPVLFRPRVRWALSSEASSVESLAGIAAPGWDWHSPARTVALRHGVGRLGRTIRGWAPRARAGSGCAGHGVVVPAGSEWTGMFKHGPFPHGLALPVAAGLVTLRRARCVRQRCAGHAQSRLVGDLQGFALRGKAWQRQARRRTAG